jgi:hypothetical protein
MYMAMSGIFHVPVSDSLGEVAVTVPTYVTSTPFTVPMVTLGSPSPSPEPQAERKIAKDAIARKFFMTCSPFLGYSLPHPERDVKFLFLHRVIRGEKALFEM